LLNTNTKSELINLIELFFYSFDIRDWNQMKNCLSDELELDYESFRGTPKYISTSDDYIAKRKIGLAGLKTEHNSSDYAITESDGIFKCNCSFEIKRYEIISKKYFHSFGKYEIGAKRINGELKIYEIKQDLERNEGDENIHGAFKF